MTTTPVGMRCPECARQRTQVRSSVGRPGGSDAPATFTLMGLCVAAFVVEAVGGGTNAVSGGGKIVADGGLFAAGVADGEPYRIVTAALLHAGILHLAFNMFALYVLGTLLEPAIGTARFLGIYTVSVLAGSLGALLLSPDQLTVGASGGIFGLMAAAFLIARHRGLDELASQVGFFVVINLVFTFSVSNISIGGHLGGLIGGGIAALVVNALHRRGDARFEIGALVALCVVTAVGAIVVANVQAPPGI